MAEEPGDVYEKLDRFLLQIRSTVHQATKKTPSELMFGQTIRTFLNLLKPQEPETLSSSTPNTSVKHYNVGDYVQARNYGSPRVKWKYGCIEKRLGELHYLIRINYGVIWKCHFNQIRRCGKIQNDSDEEDSQLAWSEPDKPVVQPNPVVAESATPLQRSNRIRRAPERLNL